MMLHMTETILELSESEISRSSGSETHWVLKFITDTNARAKWTACMSFPIRPISLADNALPFTFDRRKLDQPNVLWSYNR